MWSVVYEGLSGYSEGRLPIEHCTFYAANVLEALSYMHGRGVAYRDLKPENIMMDAQVSFASLQCVLHVHTQSMGACDEIRQLCFMQANSFRTVLACS